jgi:hypothetical protein
MRYKVIEFKDGTYAVDAGRGRYYSETVTSDRSEAERKATLWSMQWYYTKCEEAYAKGVDDGLFDDGVTMGDLLC